MASININQISFQGGVISPRREFAEDDVLYHQSVASAKNWLVTQQGSLLTRCGSSEVGQCQSGDVRLFRLPSVEPNESDMIVEVGSAEVAVWVNDVRITVAATPPNWAGTLNKIQAIFDVNGDDAGLASTGRLIMVHPAEPPKRIYRDNLNAWQFTNMHSTVPTEWGPSNYPWTVAMFQNRLWYVGAPVQRTAFWASKAGAPETIAPTGTNPDDPLTFMAIMEGTPCWVIASSDVMTIGTTTDEYQLTAVGGGAVTAASALLRRSSSHSSSRIQSRVAEEQVLFASRSQAKVYSINYIREQDNWKADEISSYAEHLFSPPVGENRSVRNMVHLADADKGLWVLLDNGNINYCCFDKTEGTKAWSELDFGDPIDDVAVGFTLLSDYVYMAIKRDKVIGGVQQTYTMMEKVPAPRTEWKRADGWVAAAVDSNGVVSNLDRFIGKTVSVFSEFGQEAEVDVVAQGQTYQILQYDNTISYYVGYVIDNEVKTLPPSIGNSKQTLVGSSLRTVSAQLALYRSVPPLVNGEEPDDRESEEIMDRRSLDFTKGTPDNGLNNIRPEYSPRGYEDDGRLTIEVREPFLCEIVSISSEVQSNRV